MLLCYDMAKDRPKRKILVISVPIDTRSILSGSGRKLHQHCFSSAMCKGVDIGTFKNAVTVAHCRHTAGTATGSRPYLPGGTA